MSFLQSAAVQQVWRSIRLFGVTFLAALNLGALAGGKAAIIAAALSAIEVAYRAVFKVEPAATRLGLKRKTNL